MKKIEENNKLIAEFMAEKPVKSHHNQYHISWNELIPVVSKITRNEIFIENEWRESIMDTVPYGLIEDSYKVVVEFIKWYNENN